MWHVYLLECSDKTFYTGITNNLKKRIQSHQAGKASRYTRGRLPVRLVYEEPCRSRGNALRREFRIKQWPRAKKQDLIP